MSICLGFLRRNLDYTPLYCQKYPIWMINYVHSSFWALNILLEASVHPTHWETFCSAQALMITVPYQARVSNHREHLLSMGLTYQMVASSLLALQTLC